MVILNNPDFEVKSWHTFILLWAALFLSVFFNTIVSRWLPKLEGLILVLHILGFFAITIPLVYMAPHSSPGKVFTTFKNLGGFPTQGLSLLVGMIGNCFAFLGSDSAIHVCLKL